MIVKAIAEFRSCSTVKSSKNQKQYYFIKLLDEERDQIDTFFCSSDLFEKVQKLELQSSDKVNITLSLSTRYFNNKYNFVVNLIDIELNIEI